MEDSPNDIALKVDNVSKSFILPHQKADSIKSAFVNPFQRYSKEMQHALKDISFEIKKGEFFGIVGRNGSGKSTLLKCIAGIYKPDKGSININGSLVPFIELGVGFNSDLSGRDNVYLNGAMLGFSREEIDGMYDEIVEFAELEKFMDQKLKNYSSGMQVRLAFSIAIRSETDILLLDEVLAVGDASFQRKCYDYFASLKRAKKTIILVSHNMSAIERFCDRAILLDSSTVKHIGTSSEIASMYDDLFLQEEAEKNKDSKKNGADSSLLIDKTSLDFLDVKVTQEKSGDKGIKAFKKFNIQIKFRTFKDIQKTNIGINIKNSQGNIVYAADTMKKAKLFSTKANADHTVDFEIDNIYTNGNYVVNVSMADCQNELSAKPLLKKRSAAKFTIYGIHEYADSIVHPSAKITIKSDKVLFESE